MHFLFISFPIEDAFGQSQMKLLLILAHFLASIFFSKYSQENFHILPQQPAFRVNLDALAASNPDLSPTKPQITSSALARPVETAKSKRECTIYTRTQTPEQSWSPHSSWRINLENCAVRLPPINQWAVSHQHTHSHTPSRHFWGNNLSSDGGSRRFRPVPQREPRAPRERETWVQWARDWDSRPLNPLRSWKKGQKVLEMEEMVFSSHWGWDDVIRYMTDSCELFLSAINQHVNQIADWFPFIYIFFFMSPCNC